MYDKTHYNIVISLQLKKKKEMGRGVASFWILSLTQEGISPTVFWLSIDQQYV